MGKPEKIVPAQQKGGRSTTEYTIKLKDSELAKSRYDRARNNLLNVNNWHELAGTLSAEFQITDSNGRPVNGLVREGNYFRIGMPAIPGNPEGKGFDWVRVEKIEEEKNPDFEWTVIRVRPATSPVKNTNPGTAHFFTNEASSSFCVQRKGNRLTASVFGRNEKPNVGTINFFARIRNALIAIAAILGMSKTQWRSLVKGIIEK
jgi:hypothetical protein